MTSPATDRRPMSGGGKPPPQQSSSRARLLTSLVLALLVIRGQLYIASTFAGTRPRPAVHLSPPEPSTIESAWEHCASLIATGLDDIGDAGRIWLRHAYVGSNHRTDIDHDDLPPDNPDDKYRCRCLIPELHPGEKPRITAIVQSFNHHFNIPNISSALKSASSIHEIVVNEDGSTDGSLSDWHSALTDDSHLIIRSNNLHELRSYNRAMGMSSGDIVVLLQDDDRLPPSDTWIRNAERLFAAVPELGVLGGYVGQMWDYESGRGLEYGEQMSSHGGLRGGDTKPIRFIEPKTNLPFMFVECVWIAPVFIRRELLRKIGGLELTIAKRNEPGVWQDCVYSYEAWINGYSVGVYSAKFERGVGGHGSASSTLKVKKRERVYERAVAYANRKFQRRRIHDWVHRQNNETLKIRSDHFVIN